MESALEDNSEQVMSPKKMISASTSPLTSKGEHFGGTPPSASYKPRMMRGEFRIWSKTKSIFHRLKCSTLEYLIILGLRLLISRDVLQAFGLIGSPQICPRCKKQSAKK